MPTPLLDLNQLTFEVDRYAILDRLELAIGPREIHALLGANGSGKTTLAHFLFVRLEWRWSCWLHPSTSAEEHHGYWG